MSGTSPPPLTPQPDEIGVLKASLKLIQTRILAGLLAALPLAMTLFIVRYLYLTVITVLTPLIEAVRRYLSARDLSDEVWSAYVAPLLAVLLVLFFLYTLGLFVRTRLMRAFDAVMTAVPVVGTIFKAVSNVSDSLMRQLQGNVSAKRTVLVEFPHPGMKSLAFVTNTLHDTAGGGTILCVCVLTGVMPPAGFTLFVPEEDVVDVDWSMNQTLQAILSGGITTPAAIRYSGASKHHVGGPILDAEGHPVPRPEGD